MVSAGNHGTSSLPIVIKFRIRNRWMPTHEPMIFFLCFRAHSRPPDFQGLRYTDDGLSDLVYSGPQARQLY